MSLKSITKRLALLIAITNLLSCQSLNDAASKHEEYAIIPHAADSTLTTIIATTGPYHEYNFFGFPGALFAKAGGEVGARVARNLGYPDLCVGIATGIRAGGWAGLSATLAGLAIGTTPPMAIAGVAAFILTYQWSKNTAILTCKLQETYPQPPNPDMSELLDTQNLFQNSWDN